MKKYWQIIKEAGADFMEDKALRLAAALAYYAVFSIGPLLVLVVGVAGLVMGEESVRQQIDQQLKGMVGAQSAGLVESMMSPQSKGDSLLATIIGGVALLFGASGVFGQLQEALNTIWEVQPKPGQGVMGFIRQRFLSMSMVLGTGFLLLISMVLTTLLSSFAGWIGNMISTPEWVIHTANLVLSFGLITLLFAAIFKVLPDVEIQWKNVWVGAIVTAFLFTAGKYLLGLYLGRESTTSAYGAGAAFVVVLLYIYYSSVILFFGAEFTQVYAKHHGMVIEPSTHAEPLTEEARQQQGNPRTRKQSPTGAGGKQKAAHAPGLAYAGGSTAFDPAPTTMKYSQSSSVRVTPQRGPKTFGRPVAPLEAIRNQPMSFVIMAAGAGLAAAFLLKFKTAQRLLKIYNLARRVL